MNNIQKLKPQIISHIQSSVSINSITQCVTELVLNSLDAKATAIAVRVNLITFRIQVVDNGQGISKDNMELVGLRYCTNKCNNLNQLENHVKTHGFRGEALSSIANLSNSVEIISRYTNSTTTYRKILKKSFSTNNNKVSLVKNRPSHGTTVTIDGFLNSVPVRKARVKQDLELDELKISLEKLIIIYPKVSFSLRNDVNSKLLLSSKKNNDVLGSFRSLYPEITEDFTIFKVSKNKINVEALFHKEVFEDTGRRHQLLYVNKRPIVSHKIQKFVNDMYKKVHKNHKIQNIKEVPQYPAFIINIKCPHSQIDLLLNSEKTFVEFKNWNDVMRCIEKLVQNCLGTTTLEKQTKTYDVEEFKNKSGGGISQVKGAVRACAVKRRKTISKDVIPKKLRKNEYVSRYIENTQSSKKSKSILKNSIKEIFFKNNNNNKRSKTGKLAKKTENLKKPKTPAKNIINEEPNEIISLDLFENSLKPIKNNPTTNYDLTNNIQAAQTTKDATQFNAVKKYFPEKCFAKPLPIIKIPHPVIPNHDLKVPPPHNSWQFNDPDQSFFSKFTDNEQKGKKLIMDMFLKSTQVYHSEDDFQEDPNDKSEETILESNFLFQNNIQTRTIDLNATMSYSFKVTSRKLHKSKNNLKRKTVDCAVEVSPFFKTDKCLQTSQKMVSKCIQTTLIPENDNMEVNNYTVCVPQSLHKFEFKEPVFNFGHLHSTDFVCPCNQNPDLPLNDLVWDQNKKPLTTLQIPNMNVRLKHAKPLENYVSTPYFSKKDKFTLQRNLQPFHPKAVSTPTVSNFVEEQTDIDMPNNANINEDLFRSHNVLWKMSHNNSSSQFDDVNNSSHSPAIDLLKPSNWLKSAESNKNITPTEVSSNLLVTLTDNNNLNRKCLNMPDSEIMDLEDQFARLCSSEEKSVVTGKQKLTKGEWCKKFNKFGSHFYINKRTGMTTFYTPKQEDTTTFNLLPRFEFIPKGLSPILKEVKEVDKSLSPNSKEKLQNAILDSYENELLIVKWRNYSHNTDPKTFFEEVYKDKTELYEQIIPTTINNSHVQMFNAKLSDISFTETLFKELQVIGQMDRKFIITYRPSDKMLIVFDQHAVDERIRLERLLKEYENASFTLKQKFSLFINGKDIELLKNHVNYLEGLGFLMEFFDNGVHILRIPLCLHNKYKNYETDLLRITQILINEIVEFLRSTKNFVPTLPVVLQKVINLEACRGAIKFGDLLSKEECWQLLTTLSVCKLPFQCAHGRPTLTPLIILNNTRLVAESRICLQKLTIHT